MMPNILLKPTSVLPLTFDRVNDGRSLTSSSPIFILPVELLGHITPYLSSCDLASLAMVDHDCRQLARSIQFANIKLDRSEAAMGLLGRLAREIQDTSCRTIGSCVRRLVVANDRVSDCCALEWETLLWATKEDRGQGHTSEEESESSYLSALCEVIGKALPNLHTLQWDRITLICPQILECIAASPVKHLRLNRIMGDYAPQEHFRGWGLETLAINVYGVLEDTAYNHNSFFFTALRRAAPGLRGLMWNGGCLKRLPGPPADELVFPHLRDLVLESFGADDKALATFLGPNTVVRSLSIDSTYEDVSKFLCRRGHIASLQAFCWKNRRADDHGGLLSFLEENLQLSSFQVVHSLPETFIDSCLLPTLEQFHNLTSLSLVWDSEVIPLQSLRTLSFITSLRHLQLSAGNQWGWRHNWNIDHDMMLDVLQRLRFLEHIIFSRDSYYVNEHPLQDPGGYYENHNLPQDTPLSDYLDEDELSVFQLRGDEIEGALILGERMITAAWERWHQSRMLGIGARYAKSFPNLKWCYLGQLLMNTLGSADDRHASLALMQRVPPSFLKHEMG